MPGGAAGEPGLTTFCEHGGLVHRPVLASLLGGAFASGKSFEYSLGPPEDMVQRVQLLEWIYQRILPLWHLHHPTLFWLAPDENPAAVKAMLVLRLFDCNGKLVAPGRKEGVIDLLRSGAWAIPCRVGLTAYLRGQRHDAAGKYLHRMWAQRNGQHRRIDLVCTAPESQGFGLASRLLWHVCTEADKNHQLLYLSSSDPSNQRYYERFGFEKVGSVSTEPGVITTVAMARACAAGSTDSIVRVGQVVWPAKSPPLPVVSRLTAAALTALAFVLAVRKLQPATHV